LHNSLCELCNVPHILDISKGSIHDAKILETIINDKLYNNYKYLNIIGDKGYIKNAEYINYIQSKNITLITPLKINAICNNKLSADKTQLLKDRYKVEHFFSYLKRGFKRVRCINDKLLSTYNNFLYISASLLSLRIIINL
jgi:hypothetical protein